ncbi:MAG: Rpn family recombination-promoting nuclease/putative transposase [Spirulinaceae cyanobacterium]
MSNTHIRFDWAIKRILRNKANYVVLEGFLSELLHQELTIKTLLESEGNQQTQEDKTNRVDILAETPEGELILVEVQNNSQLDYFHRMLYGASRLVVEYLQEGEQYGKIRKIYSVNIVYFNLGVGDDYIYHHRGNFVGINNRDILQPLKSQEVKFKIEAVADIFPEYYLLKVNNFNDEANTPLDEWIYFLKNSNIKEEFVAKGMLEAKETLLVNNLSEQERVAYSRYMQNKSYEASMLSTQEFETQWKIEQAEVRGRQEERIAIARSCKQRGLDVETIIEITQLSREEIESL